MKWTTPAHITRYTLDISKKPTETPMSPYPALCLKVDLEYQFIFPAEIVQVHSEGSYSIITLKSGKKLTISKKIKDVEALLPRDIFMRVHHSDIINLMYLSSFSNDTKALVYLSTGAVVQVSRRKKVEFMERFLKI